MARLRHEIRIKGGDKVVVEIIDDLKLDDVYEHEVKVGIYNLLRGVKKPIVKKLKDSFVGDLR